MSEKKEVLVQSDAGVEEKCVLMISQSPPWKISFSGLGESVDYEAGDLFKALVSLTKDLEKKKCKLLCNGARRDIHPSGMSRDMSGGRKAYVISLGSPARRESLVDIFDYASPELVSTVSEQENFYRKWVASLK